MVDRSVDLLEIGERALIERIQRRVGPAPDWIRVGIGDDAAIIEPARGELQVVTTDALVEHVHFRRDWTPAHLLGRKSLAVNLSDLAAMGATPRASFLSLSLPGTLALEEFDAMVDGFVTLAEMAKAPLAGGNITRSPGPLVIDVTAIGSVHRRQMLLRSGGRAGDDLYVTGSLGGAAAGLAMLEQAAARDGLDESERDCIGRYERPEPRLRCGIVIARSRSASACIDLSDGLAAGARQIAEASGAGVVIDAAALPVHPGAASWAARTGADPITTALAGGEDYELLFAVPARRTRGFLAAVHHCRHLPVTRVGRLTKEPGAQLERDGRSKPLPTGFVHF